MKIKITGGLKDKIKEYYIQTICMLFFPGNDVNGTDGRVEAEITVESGMCGNTVEVIIRCGIKIKSIRRSVNAEDDLTLAAGRIFYDAAAELTDVRPPWGVHTGIRPAKTAGMYYEKTHDNIKTLERLQEEYYMRADKAAAVLSAYHNGVRAVSRAGIDNKKAFSLFASIPFCPTRCAYCSFTSYPAASLYKLIPNYIGKLISELKIIAEITREFGLSLASVYIGGGTPTILEEEQLDDLFGCIYNEFNILPSTEYTVEAGRPDTITVAKLTVLKKYGVNRISVNPQTLNDDTLIEIGRKHTVGDFYTAYGVILDSGIKCINTDIIIGLPGEDKRDAENTLNGLLELNPHNITMHTLCVKKSAYLKADNIYKPYAPEMDTAVDFCYNILSEHGYFPYYMYKQKYSVGNLENTGFSLEGYECMYNIYMMDELHTIFGAGAGAMTKIVGGGGKIERIANYKYPYEYLNNELKMVKTENMEILKKLI